MDGLGHRSRGSMDDGVFCMGDGVLDGVLHRAGRVGERVRRIGRRTSCLMGCVLGGMLHCAGGMLHRKDRMGC